MRRGPLLTACVLLLALAGWAALRQGAGPPRQGPDEGDAQCTQEDLGHGATGLVRGDSRQGLTFPEVKGPRGRFGYARRRALVVGLSRYYVLDQLGGVPGADAAAVASVLATRFGFEQVELLTDRSPPAGTLLPPDRVQKTVLPGGVGAEVIRARLRALRGREGARDALLFFFAGHGLRLGGRGYLAPADADLGQAEALLDLADVARELQACRAHHTLLVLDSCHSGIALEPDSGVEAAVGAGGPWLREVPFSVDRNDNLARVFARRGFQVICASTGREAAGNEAQVAEAYAALARERPEYRGHSPFTATLLQALQGRVGRPDGVLQASALGYFVADALVNVEELRDVQQVPRYGPLGGGEGDFLFLPAHPVLDPRHVAPLYLPGPQYARLRASACEALAEDARGDHLPALAAVAGLPAWEVVRERQVGLARAAVPHLAGVLAADTEDGPRLVAATALGDLARAHARHVPEFDAVLRPLAALVGDPRAPADLRRETARAVAELGERVRDEDREVVDQFARYIEERAAAWEATKKQTVRRLKVREEAFRLPDIRLEEEKVAAPPAASAAARLRHLEARRQRLEQLPAALQRQLDRHATGLSLLGRAKQLAAEKDYFGAKLLVAEAVGFEGFGRSTADDAFRSAHPEYLMPGSPEWEEARAQVLTPPYYRLLWSSPVPTKDDLRKRSWGDMSAVAFAPDGLSFACGTGDGEVRLWDLRTGRPTRQLIGWAAGEGNAVYRLAYSPDGRLLAVARAGDVWLWDLTRHEPAGRRLLAGGADTPHELAFSPDGARLAASSRGGPIRVWDAATAQHVADLKEPGTGLGPLAFSPDGGALALATTLLYPDRAAHTIQIWDVAGKKLLRPNISSPSSRIVPISRLAFAPDGRALASAGADIGLWDWRTGELIASLTGDEGLVARDLSFSPDGQTLASAGYKVVQVWDLVSRRELARLGHKDGALGLAFAPDGRTLAVAGDRHVRLWEVAPRADFALLDQRLNGFPTAVAYSPDGRHLACAALNTVVVWDLRTETPRQLEIGAQGGGVFAIAFSPDGRLLASATPDGIWLWDTTTWTATAVLKPPPDTAPDRPETVGRGTGEAAKGGPTAKAAGFTSAIAFAPGGGLGCVVGAGDVVRLDLKTGKQAGPALHHPGVAKLAYSPDGRHLASAGTDGQVRVWRLSSGELLRGWQGHTGPISDLAYTPDGRNLVTGGGDGVVRVWGAGDGKECLRLSVQRWRLDLRGWGGSVSAITLAPQGRIAAAAANDEICFWDRDSGQEVARYRVPSAVRALAFAPNGQTIASALLDRVIRVWRRPAPLQLTPLLNWYTITGREVTRKEPSDAPVRDGDAGFLSAPPGSLVGALRGGASPEERDHELFGLYLRAGDLNAAALTARLLPAGDRRRKAEALLAERVCQAAFRALEDRLEALAALRYRQARDLAPEHPQCDYLAARLTLARDRSGADKEAAAKALADLEAAVRRGLDWKTLEAAEGLQRLRSEPRFARLVERAAPPEEWVRRGYEAQRSDARKAIECYTKAIALDAKYAQAYTARGFAQASLKAFEPALADFRAAAALRPVDPWPHYALARGYCLSAASRPATPQGTQARQKDVESALDALEKASALGWADLGRLKQDPDFKPLLGHPRYRKLTGGR